MSYLQNTQGGAAKAPPIPSMDVSPPPAATSREVRQQVRDMVKQAKVAAQDAKKNAQDAQKLAQAPSHTATTTVPPSLSGDDIPPNAVNVSLAFFLTVAVCVVGLPIARALGRRIDRKTEVRAMPGADLTPHIRQLQDSVDAMAIELERISEGQRFTAKLLAERSGGAAQQQ